MPEAVPYADIIVLALIAAFILLRLRNTLGKHDEQQPPAPRNTASGQELAGRIVKIGERPKPIQDDQAKAKQEEEDAALCEPLALAGAAAIRAADSQFTVTGFMEGARGAFEMVFESFSRGDKETLKMLLADDVYATFEEAMRRRDQEANKTETTLVSIESARVENAGLNGLKARIAVAFVSEQVTIVRSPEGEIVEGDATQTHRVEDHWVFEREISSRNPNWKIIDT